MELVLKFAFVNTAGLVWFSVGDTYFQTKLLTV